VCLTEPDSSLKSKTTPTGCAKGVNVKAAAIIRSTVSVWTIGIEGELFESWAEGLLSNEAALCFALSFFVGFKLLLLVTFGAEDRYVDVAAELVGCDWIVADSAGSCSLRDGAQKSCGR
jgi:hypothetical protein